MARTPVLIRYWCTETSLRSVRQYKEGNCLTRATGLLLMCITELTGARQVYKDLSTLLKTVSDDLKKNFTRRHSSL